MTRGLLLAFAALVAADLAILVDVRLDRTSDDIVMVTLDERELRLVPQSDTSSAVLLQFADQRDSGLRTTTTAFQPVWIDQPQLTALGFDCTIWPADPRAANHYRAQLVRGAVVAFDVGTDVWQRRLDDWTRRVRAHAAAEIESGTAAPVPDVEAAIADAATRASRLVPIEVGGDGRVMRGKYRGRRATLVLPVVVGLQFDAGTRLHSRAEVTGRIAEVYPQMIAVPARFGQVFTGLPSPTLPPASPPFAVNLLPHPPRYDVTLAIGPAMQPWIVDARRLGPKASSR